MMSGQLQDWVGRSTERVEALTVARANQMQATLNRRPDFQAGAGLPPAWHWLYFPEVVPAAELGEEGHPRLGGFMPPVVMGDRPPRRMWAGGKLSFLVPLHLGERVQKRSTIVSVTPKEGRSGALVFVVVGHDFRVAGELRLREEQTVVYREASAGSVSRRRPEPAPTDAEFAAAFTPDPILLFRYSALTFNAHRIHYDVDYCRQQEGYPDLVVHGPLTATLILDLFHRQFPDRPIRHFSYRGVSPLFNPHPFTVQGKADGAAWASDHRGGLAMTAQISYQ